MKPQTQTLNRADKKKEQPSKVEKVYNATQKMKLRLEARKKETAV